MHVMLDLETLGTGPRAPIIQIGAVIFDWLPCPDMPDGMIGNADGGWFRVNVASSDWVGIDPDTLLWWLKQDAGVRARVFDQSEAQTLKQALWQLSAWMGGMEDIESVWAGPASFDLTILSQSYERQGLERPWGRRAQRCFSTLKRVVPGADKLEPEFVGSQHDALDDAVHQALWCAKIMQRVETL